MASRREHIELKERPVDVPPENQQSPESARKLPGLSKRVGAAATLCLLATAATAALLVSSGAISKQQTNPQPDFASSSAQNSDLHKAVKSSLQSPVLSSPLQVSRHPKSEVEARIRQIQEKHRQRNVPDPNYEEVAVQLKRELEHDTGGPLPSSGGRARQRSPPHPLPHPADPRYVEEEITLEHYEEHDSPKHPKNVRIQSNHSQDSQPQTQPDQDEGQSRDTKEETESKSNAKKNTPTNKNDTNICETEACYEAARRISESLDLSVDPCEDFYQFACGGWIDKHPVPESGWAGTYVEAVSRMDQHLLQILETPAVPDAPRPLQDIRTLYATCTDTDTLDGIGLDPLINLLSAQGGWPMLLDNWDPAAFSLPSALNSLRNLNVYPLIHVSNDINVFNTSRWLIYVDAGQVPIGVNLMASMTGEALAPYRTFMTAAATMLRDALGSSVTDTDIDDQVNEVIRFEIKFSELMMKAVTETTNHAWQTTVAELQQDTDAGTPNQFHWLAFLEEMFTETSVTITEEESLLSFKGPFFREFSNLLATTEPKTLANAVVWWWVYNLQEETTYAMRNASYDYLHDFYGLKPTSRRQHCLAITNANLGFALSREYVDKVVPKTVKPEVTEMVEDLRHAFSSLLDNNTWMQPQDLLVAREKLADIDPFVAYPDWIMDDQELTKGYEGLELQSGDNLGNLVHIGSWFNYNALEALRDTPEHTFLYPPTIVNAVYNPTQNSISILGGILQSPFYGNNSLAALNYGGIGMVIGHEMTHGFDSIGRMFDKHGNLVQWWSAETIEAFNQRALCFVKQYDKYVPPELSDIGLQIPVNGVQTLAENIADNGGIREGFRAYQAYVDRYGEEQTLPGLSDFSPQHIFYLGFANAWCEHKSAEMVLKLLVLDAHSPGRFRVQGSLSNDEEFSRVWQCPAGSPMNTGKDRCLLW